MRHRSPRVRILLLLVAAALSVAATAAPETVYEPVSASVWVEGTSTLHDWRVEGPEIEGRVRVASDLLAGDGASPTFQAAGKVRIPLGTLESGKPKMDELMLQALAVEEHPYAVYKVSGIRRTGRRGDAVVLAAAGELTLAGTTRAVELELEARPAEGDRLLVEGSVPLRMTDFGIEPPRAMLGTLKTGDEVRVGFRWLVAAGPSAERP